MKPETLQAALNSWDARHGYQTAGVAIKVETVVAVDDLETALGLWVGGDGWIARQSAVKTLPREIDDPTQGYVTSAELTTGSATLQIRRSTTEWVLTTLTETDDNDCLADVIELVTVGGGAAVYRRYWKLPDSGATEIIAWRFTGFTGVR